MSKNLSAFLAAIAILVLMFIGGYFETPGGMPTGYVGAFNRHRGSDKMFKPLPAMRGGRRSASGGGFAFHKEPLTVPFACTKEAMIKRLKDSGMLKRLTLTEKQANLKTKLMERGFKNEEYINLQLKALASKEAFKALRKAQELIQKGQYEECIDILDDALSRVSSDNLIARQELLNVLLRANLLCNCLIRAEDVSKQLFQVSQKILDIKSKTILMNDPYERRIIEKDKPLVQKYLTHHSEMFAALRERHQRTGSWNGLLPEEIKKGKAKLEEARRKSQLTPAQYAQALRSLDRGQYGPQTRSRKGGE